MTPDQWRQIKSVLAEALDAPPDDRSAVVDHACGGDPSLRREVEMLLAAMEEGATDPLLPELRTALADRYTVEREIGRGGMAIVYLARDLRHERLVAIKVLRPELTALLGAERFLREISITAHLQHPNILPLFDSGQTRSANDADSAGLLFYVMPFVDGDSLRARLARERQLPVRETLHIATSVAGALAYAHAQGVIHRDLKPENILLQAGEPMVADFGIALAVEQAAGERLTETGLSLGTPRYMAPEQATGERRVTARADVYALGVILYEMLAGEPPFTGADAQAVLSRVLTETPRALNSQRPSVPPTVDAAVHTALEKLPADRFASATEFARALEGPVVGSTGAGEGPSEIRGMLPIRGRHSRRTVALIGVVSISGALAGMALDRGLHPAGTAETAPVRFTIQSDSGMVVWSSPPAIAPDGRTIVYSVADPDRERLYARRLDDLEPRALAGTEDGRNPFFSPDGAWVAFVSGREIRKVPLTGGPVTTVARVPGTGWHGGAWSTDDTIYFGTSDNLCYRVPAAGGTASALAIRDSTAGMIGCETAFPIPDRRSLLVTLRRDSGPATMAILDLPSGNVHHLSLGRGTPTRYAKGYLVYDAEGRLYRQPFDLRRSVATGPEEELAEDVSAFDISQAGALAYNVGMGGPNRPQGARMTLTDRTGRELQTFPAHGPWVPRFSPDGKRLAYGAFAPGQQQNDLWVTDLAAGTTERLTTDGALADDNDPQWSPGGDSIAYSAGPSEPEKQIFVRALAGGPARRLTRAAGDFPSDWSADGRTIPFTRLTRDNDLDIWVQPVSGGAPHPYIVTAAREFGARVSPDGRWAAYTSVETGRSEVYVQSYPTPGQKTPISTVGGFSPIWGRDGRTLYYWESSGLWSSRQLVAVTIAPAGADGRLMMRGRTPLFRAPFLDNVVPNYDVSPDGSRIVLVTPQSGAIRLVVALHALDPSRAGARR